MQPSSTDPTLGTLLHTRTHTALGHTLGAAFLFLVPTVVLSSIILFTKQKPGVEPMSLAEKAIAIAIIIAVAGAAALYLLLKGRRGRKQIEVYDRGLRLRYPNRPEVTFLYSDVQQIKRRIFKNMLASVEFTLTDGTAHTLDVHSPKDSQLLSEILARYGNIPWQPDNTFRIM